jgi:hypothetical protein
MTSASVETALGALGELLAADGIGASVVVVGGAALIVLGYVDRVTQDVDVIASRSEMGVLVPPELSEAVWRAARTVARDFELPNDWFNTEVAAQWRGGLPPSLAHSLVWKRYGNLEVGFAGRAALIALKLFAAVDGGPGGVHFQDLVRLRATAGELAEGAVWVKTQDASPDFAGMVDEVARRAVEGE